MGNNFSNIILSIAVAILVVSCISKPKVVPQPKAGDIRIMSLPDGEKLELVFCPPGQVTLDRVIGYDQERDQYNAVFTNGFWIGKYPITQKQWISVTGYMPMNLWRGDGSSPMKKTSWAVCKIFCDKIGNGLRIPTEAEWVYACRSGDNNKWLSVTNITPWGVCDIRGRHLEWCADSYVDCSACVVTNPSGYKYGTYNIVRGMDDSRTIDGKRVLRRKKKQLFRTPPQMDVRLRVCCSVDPSKDEVEVKEPSDDVEVFSSFPGE